jgi:hypothetical protein
MMRLNFSNIESLILENGDLKYILPSSLHPYIEQWKIGQQFPMLRQLGRQALFDLINALDDKTIESLEKFFGQRIIVEKLNYNIVENIMVPVEDAAVICDHLSKIRGFNYFSTWRDDKYLHITFWR